MICQILHQTPTDFCQQILILLRNNGRKFRRKPSNLQTANVVNMQSVPFLTPYFTPVYSFLHLLVKVKLEDSFPWILNLVKDQLNQDQVHLACRTQGIICWNWSGLWSFYTQTLIPVRTTLLRNSQYLLGRISNTTLRMT